MFQARFLSALLLPVCLAAQAPPWTRSGGPIGGLGYNIKIHPTNKAVLFVTDAFSGVHRSMDSGKTWAPANNGITTRSGPSGDAIPVFSLALDKRDPNIIWAGTQGMRGIFKSTDGGNTYGKKDSGISENEGLTIRNFEIHPWSSDTVYASGELATGVQGGEFERVKGVIYKTANGGNSWSKIWEDSSLARWVCINSVNPQGILVATGIFDREALNGRGEGILRTENGGQTWSAVNQGLASLFVGGMAAHPTTWGALLIGTGNYTENRPGNPIFGGVYTTTYPGYPWIRVLGPQDSLNPGSPDNVFTAVAYAPSNASVLYAANAVAFYRSQNGGSTWTRYAGQNGAPYGPPGVRAGVPIEITVDKDNPDVLFVINYGGGVFKSTDGARNWRVLGSGYTGANLHAVAVKDGLANDVLITGRSGPFHSRDGGALWTGEAADATIGPAEWFGAAQQPGSGTIRLLSDEHMGKIFRHAGPGADWVEVFKHPGADPSTPAGRHGAKALSFSPTDPQTVFAGFAAAGFYSQPEDTAFARSFGVYKSMDGGLTWNEKNTGLDSAGRNVLCFAMTPADSFLVYAGTRGRGIFKSLDRGETWADATANLPTNFVHAAAISFTNPRVVYVATKDKGVFKSSNGGVTWNPVLSDTVFNSGQGKLMMSLAVDPKSENRVYAADLRHGVYRTLDGGIQWDVFNQGLSTKAVNALGLSSDGSTLYAATQGEGVFRLQIRSPDAIQPRTPRFNAKRPTTRIHDARGRIQSRHSGRVLKPARR